MPDYIPSVILPRITYRHVGAAASYLGTAFGFEPCDDTRFFDDDGELVLTEMQLNGHRVMLGSEGNHGQSSPASLDGVNTQMLVVYVDDADAHHQQAVEAGAEIVMALDDAPWGDRRYEALDLEGHRWAFHQRLAGSTSDSGG